MPLRIFNNTFDAIHNIASMAHSKDIIEQNASFKRQIDLLKNQVSGYREMESENDRLKKLLAFKQSNPYKLIAARIISKDSSNICSSILIDQGKKSGVKEDTVVMVEAGLLGRVSEVSAGTGRVMLITDPNSRVSAIVSRSRNTGVVYGGNAGLCIMRYLPLDADLVIGDEVVTSGFSDIFPKGLLIGKIIKVKAEPTGLSLCAFVKPSADISRAEEVLCIE